MSEKPTYAELAQRISELERQSEEKYRLVVEEATQGIFIIQDGAYRYVNRRGAEIFNTTRERILSGDLFEFVHPDDRSACENRVNRRKRGETTDELLVHRIVDGAGIVKWVEVRGISIVWDGRHASMCFVTDITERKQTEDALVASEKRFRDLAELLPAALFETDIDMNLTYANPYAYNLFGYTPQDLEKGINALDLISRENREKALENISKRFRGDIFGSVEYLALRQDGSAFPVLLHASPIFENDETKGIRGIIVDLSEWKLMEEQLRQSHKMESLGTLSGGIAHEFNNILAVIIGNTDLAIGDIPDWSPAKDCLEEIRTASLRAREVVRKLLSVARKTPESRKPIQISIAVKESLDLLRRTIPATIDMRLEISCTREMILGDPAELGQILMNLCTNSVHAMRDQRGILEVNLETTTLDRQSARHYEDLRPGAYARLTVKDNGEGIEPQLMERLFDPYFTTKDVDEGLGMGLAVVHGIVKNHDGAIKIDSASGKGTTVEVLFPLIEEPAAVDTEKHETSPRGTERILFVDDESSLVKLATQMLKRSGYDVVGKTSGSDALKLFQENPERFDLVITDMAMPDMAGDRLAQKIIRIRPNTPIILCTGHSDRMNENRAKQLGIRAFAMKPLGKADLARTVRKVLDAARRI